MFKNRVEKNLKKLEPWANRMQIEAYRIYDRDIPEFPFMVDRYKDYFLVHDRTDEEIDRNKNQMPEVIQSLIEIFKVPENQIVIKRRERKSGTSQYERLAETDSSATVRESQALFKINLYDFLDTGLFLDHRPIRQIIFKSAKGKKFLNLFCYTGSVSVFAALGGAETTSIDMSGTYLDWAKDNFKLNNIDCDQHRFFQENVLAYLSSPIKDKYDMIFLDPPTFSNSKRMESDFEVEKDQEFLVDSCMGRLNQDGILYFSNNKRRFRLSDDIKAKYFVRDITEKSIPQDFHDKKIHNCFEIRHPRVSP